MANEVTSYYPNCDSSVWIRTCEEEILTPISGFMEGVIPEWLNGTLLRNGPGSIKVGDMEFGHLFDSSALIHRFGIKDGEATYQCRFLQTETRKRNQNAQRIVVSEFGTTALPDPCYSIFNRVSSLFRPGESISDNAMISVYPFADEIYAFTETPVIHRVNPKTLETMDRINISDYVAIVNHTSHPHIVENGDVYNVGLTFKKGKPQYAVMKFPQKEGDMFENAIIMTTVDVRWPMHPSYMHTFGITENYYVILEQPLSISLLQMMKSQITGTRLNECFKWFPEYGTEIIVVKRSDGRLYRRYHTEAIFYLHIINAYEMDDSIVLDLCSYKDPSPLEAMYIDSIRTMQSNINYAEMFRSRPVRYKIPLNNKNEGEIKPKLLADIGCETPRIHYENYNGRPYRFFYAIGSDVDTDNPGIIIKVDTLTQKYLTWTQNFCYPSEPVFVPTPSSKDEDDGILLSALIWSDNPNQVGLLILNAKDLRQLALVKFQTPSPTPKCLHGWFLKNVN